MKLTRLCMILFLSLANFACVAQANLAPKDDSSSEEVKVTKKSQKTSALGVYINIPKPEEKKGFATKAFSLNDNLTIDSIFVNVVDKTTGKTVATSSDTINDSTPKGFEVANLLVDKNYEISLKLKYRTNGSEKISEVKKDIIIAPMNNNVSFDLNLVEDRILIIPSATVTITQNTTVSTNIIQKAPPAPVITFLK